MDILNNILNDIDVDENLSLIKNTINKDSDNTDIKNFCFNNYKKKKYYIFIRLYISHKLNLIM